MPYCNLYVMYQKSEGVSSPKPWFSISKSV